MIDRESLNSQLTATLLHSWNMFLGRGRVWGQYLSETLPIQFPSFKWLKRIFSRLKIRSQSGKDPHSNLDNWDIPGDHGFVECLKESFASCIPRNQGVGSVLFCNPLVVSRDFEDTITILNAPSPLRATDTRPRMTVLVRCRQEPPILPFQVVRSVFEQERIASVKLRGERWRTVSVK